MSKKKKGRIRYAPEFQRQLVLEHRPVSPCVRVRIDDLSDLPLQHGDRIVPRAHLRVDVLAPAVVEDRDRDLVRARTLERRYDLLAAKSDIQHATARQIDEDDFLHRISVDRDHSLHQSRVVGGLINLHG